MNGWIRTCAALLTVVLFVAGCRVSAPEDWGATINLMLKYTGRRQYDDAIAIAEDWIKKHPNDKSHESGFYDQIAMVYLMKASSDRSHEEAWLQQAASNF